MGRAFLLKIFALEALLPPAGECVFRVHIESAPDAHHAIGRAWIPTEGADTSDVFRVGRPGSTPQEKRMHVRPLYMLESGVIDVRASNQVSLQVEVLRAVEAAPQTSACTQRDLDDPDIALGSQPGAAYPDVDNSDASSDASI